MRLSWILLAAALCACPPTPSPCEGGRCAADAATTDDGGAREDGGVLDPVRMCIEQGNAYFDFYVRCGLYDPGSLLPRRATLESGCTSAGVGVGITSGRQRFDPEAARSCLDSIRDTSCAKGSPGDLTFCSRVSVGVVEPGGACFGSNDCVPSASCDVHATCPGRCIPRVGLGGSVQPWEHCEQGAFPYEGTCRAPLGIGESCAPSSLTNESPQCEAGLSCLRDGGCGLAPPRAENGGACSSDEDRFCLFGARCQDNVCTPYLPRDAGCMPGSQCQLGLACVQGRCVERIGTEGELCEGSSCTAGLFCATDGGATGLCERYHVAGEGCTGGRNECGAGTYCDTHVYGMSGTCRGLGDAGASCPFEFQYESCADGLFCATTGPLDPGVCQPRKEGGEPCVSSAECLSHLCNGDGGCEPTPCIDRSP